MFGTDEAIREATNQYNVDYQELWRALFDRLTIDVHLVRKFISILFTRLQ